MAGFLVLISLQFLHFFLGVVQLEYVRSNVYKSIIVPTLFRVWGRVSGLVFISLLQFLHYSVGEIQWDMSGLVFISLL